MSTLPLPPEISPSEAHALFAANRATLIDVREPFEHAIAAIPGAALLPMHTVPAALGSLPRDRPLLVLCHHGGRSRRVTQFLQTQGFVQAINVCGGIDAWARDVDPTLPRY